MNSIGDDSVTQIIPENYMTSTGDDSVTQIIPENYMTAQGDDTATVMLDPSQVQMTMSNQQPAFVQQPIFNQAPNMNQAASGNGYQQGYANPQMNYQAGYQQPAFNQGYGRTVKAVPPASKGVSLASMIIMIALLVSCIVLVTKPLFYVTQSYCGGIFSADEIEEEMVGQDEDDYEEANTSARIMFGITAVFALIGALNAWSCFARIKNNCVKSPVNKAVGNFVFGLIGVAVFVIIRSMLDEVVTDGISYGAFSEAEASMFNVYGLVFVLGIVSVVVNLVNIFTASAAKKATR